MKSIEYRDRNCDCCGSSTLREVWSYPYAARGCVNSYEFRVRNVVCTQCGFAFVSPAPTDASLAEYYADAPPIFRGGALDYSLDARLSVIDRMWDIGPVTQTTFIDVGGGDSPQFAEALRARFKRVLSVEASPNCDRTFARIEDVPHGAVTMLGAYFVLEHVPSPVEFLKNCADALCQEGVAIIEVPNRHLYPKDISGWEFYEHTNHFSPATLDRLALQAGLQLVEVSHHNCSRPFGFATVFRKYGDPAPRFAGYGRLEYLDALATMEAGCVLARRHEGIIWESRVRLQAAAQNGGVVLWGANDIANKLLSGMENVRLPGLTIVDSDPRKRDWLRPLQVHRPADVLGKIRESGLVMLATSLYAKEITEWIRDNTGRSLDPQNLHIIDLTRN